MREIIINKINNYLKLIKNKLLNKNKINNNEENYKEGIISEKDLFSPAYINNSDPKYFEIDGIYYGSLLLVNYFREQNDLILKYIIDSNIDINISIFYEKQDTYKTIRDLTFNIGSVGADLKEKNQNRQAIEIAAFTYSDAKYIRKEMQINNQELYFLYIYITTYSNNLKELEYLLNKIEGVMQAKGIQTRRGYFRQEQAYLACLPFMNNNPILKEVSKRNVLTDGLVATYPFISSTMFDENGIFIGTNIYNDSLVFIDRYNSNKYKNANICIFGTSGAGKSFYTKLLILRYRLLGIEQYVIDPEREYCNLCEKLNGTLIKLGPKSNNYINIFDIRKDSLEDNEQGYLSNKIDKLMGFFNLIFENINEEEKSLLEEKIIELYKLKNITFEDSSLYKKENNKITIKPVFKETYDMPIFQDLYELLKNDIKTNKLSIKLIPFIKGSLKYFNNYTNVKLNNKLIIADIYELGEENLKYGMYLFTELFWDKIKKDRNIKKAIYLDEIWRLIGVTSNSKVAAFIYKIFKTIRKYGGSSVAITQDISDLFSLENGTYGKSILNNSSIKTFFSLEEENIMVLEKYANLSEKEKIEIKSLKRGECLIFAGDDHILTKVESADFEKELIN